MLQQLSIPHEFANGRKVTNTYYGRIFIVSPAALAEKRANWHEYGYASGGACVRHADWLEVLATMKELEPAEHSHHVCCQAADGSEGFTGLLSPHYKHAGAVGLSG